MFRFSRAASKPKDEASALRQEQAEAPLLDHLEELRFRIIYAIVAWTVGSGIAYTQTGKLIELFKQPLAAAIKSGSKIEIIANKITDPLTTVLQVSMFAGLVLAFPIVVYQVWAFVAPGLTRTERRWGGPFVLGLGFSFAAGAAFAYFVFLPVAIPFMLGFLPGVGAYLSVGDYMTQILTYLGIFGLVFELPISMFLLAKIGLVNARMLSTFRRQAIFGIVALSAVITPTVDPISLGMMAVPLICLYEFGIVLARIAQPRKAKQSLDDVLPQSASD